MVRTAEFRLLGPLEVSDHGRLVDVPGRRQQALLVLLLLERGRVVAADALVERLWSSEPPRTAQTSLQSAVYRLRRALGADRIVTRAQGYAVRLEPDELDLDRVERLAAEAAEHARVERTALLREALALWRGPALADFRYESFAQAEIGRLEELHLSLLEERIDADLERGLHAMLVGELESLVAEHPVRERFRAQLMLALYRGGRQAEALQAYHAARHVLVEELGIEPGAHLQELERAILRQDGTLRPLGPSPSTDHFRELDDALADGRLVPVVGSGLAALANGVLPEAHLAARFDCPLNERRDLAWVSQYVAVTRGAGRLYDELHTLFDSDPEPGPAHRLLARLPAYLRARQAPQLLLVTTNYDDALEQALLDAGEAFDVVTYVARGPDRGRFVHLLPDGTVTAIAKPNRYAGLDPDERTVILKVHGQVDRAPDRRLESFVVSEDDFIQTLAHSDIARLVPVTLAARLRRSHFLFLGQTPHEWSFRVLLHRVWGALEVGYRSWAVEPEAEPLSREFWRHLDVDLLDVPLDRYVTDLERRIATVTA